MYMIMTGSLWPTGGTILVFDYSPLHMSYAQAGTDATRRTGRCPCTCAMRTLILTKAILLPGEVEVREPDDGVAFPCSPLFCVRS